MSTVIKVSDLSKIYRLGEIGTGTISRDIERWYKMKVRGQEDPFLKIGEINESREKGNSDIIYSLKNINFEVQKGEVLGIIGKNGAGKSTLLKIISRVTSPTTGKIRIKGRVTSLLEVGTGFHPELTGRENIYLNGAILGMRKKEITRKLDEIIDFSGVQRFIDTPVKRYSSGMYVRLAFAVAAHLESEILIIDEVLAVGDSEFQKKCIGKMGEVSHSEGRTILFVSHNMGAIRNLCNTSIVLKKGQIFNISETNTAINSYLHDSKEVSKEWKRELQSNSSISFLSIESLEVIGSQPNLQLPILFILNSNNIHKACHIAFDISDDGDIPLFQTIMDEEVIYTNGIQKYLLTINLPPLIPGRYYISAWIGSHNIETHDWLKNVLFFDIEESPMKNRVIPYSKNNGFMFLSSRFEKIIK
jgi:lipopolysaccharide transport system ATP-binding protein